ncbi:MAG: hypothetical protein BGO69_10900 [Bacteroidetes bacterium 46-16]|nr:MAG: hypothetical protein BGO69_10900 [Bacteroidetes bacterium 46-16]
MTPPIEISLSKVKVIWLFAGCVLFIILGAFFVIDPEMMVSPIMRSPEVVYITGITSLGFFGLCSIFVAQKLLDTTPGLIIDQNGIINNTGAINVGLIEWKDITRIETMQVMSARFIVLYVSTPEKYINRAKNMFIKQVMNLNYKKFGSPISITSISLKMDWDELARLIFAEFEKRKGY